MKIRPIWIQLGASGVFLILASHTPYAVPLLGAFMVGFAVGAWR